MTRVHKSRKKQIPPPGHVLKDYEINTVRLMAQGLTVKEAGPALAIHWRSVEGRLDRLRLSYDAKNTTHLVAMFIKKGII